MATDTEDRYSSLDRTLETPAHGQYRVPSRSRSRPARARRDSSPVASSSPSYLPISPMSHDIHSDLDDDERETMTTTTTLSPLDPRRFTPTLHASLVSEILSLRREIEDKTKVIDELERTVDDARNENESLHENLLHSAKEARSLKHQVQLLEGGTASALTELAKERDDALESITDVRRKLEQAQKKVRSREEEIERTQTLWERDKQSWDSERRNLERKVHVVEGRLKVVLTEVAAAQAAGSLPLHTQPKHAKRDSDLAQDATASRESDSASIHSSSQGRRRTSVTSVSTNGGDVPDHPDDGVGGGVGHNVRYSVASVMMHGASANLAQELAFDEGDSDDLDASDDDGFVPDSPEALPEERERPTSMQSQISNSSGMKARKILGLSFTGSLDATGAIVFSESGVADRLGDEGGMQRGGLRIQGIYCDAGIQYSPPPSPTLSPTPPPAIDVTDDQTKDSGHLPSGLSSVPADHEDVCSQATSPATEAEHAPEGNVATLRIGMVSTSCQTVGDLPSPPWTPKVVEPPVQAAVAPERPVMTSSSTQTEPASPVTEPTTENPDTEPERRATDVPIPMIAIHPPGSEPPSPRDSVVLPPQTKNASCQTNFRSIVDSQSVGIQTEEIRIDTRPVKLPASLLPSAIPDLPTNAESHDRHPVSPYRVPPPRSAKRDRRPSPAADATDIQQSEPTPTPTLKQQETRQAYPGNNDDGPLSANSRSNFGRPFRSSSLFAGFGDGSDEETARADTDTFTDDELLNRPFASYTLRRGKMVTARQRSNLDRDPLAEINEQLDSSAPVEDERSNGAVGHDGSVNRSRRGHAGMPTSVSTKQPNIRRAAMISNGAAAHQRTRARSPSLPSVDSGSGASSIAPPFPVPIRLSSRNAPFSGSEGHPSPTASSSTRNFSDRGRQQQQLVRRPTLRRVRSAAVMQGEEAERSRSRSPKTSVLSYSPESPRPRYAAPPMPYDNITAPREGRSAGRKKISVDRSAGGHSHETQRRDSASTTVLQQTSVVDAIAQTMVGEWMFKYVRRRKSFGVGGGGGDGKDSWGDGRSADEVSASITSSGARHKRWVWLAPYERAVMWSSKQPTSGPALLGKTGRKLTIQSVLDVKDDNPLPKGAVPPAAVPFNRSILILTPQRALKFTATSIERHFVWLTALSFLSHSEIGMHDLAALPPAPPPAHHEDVAPATSGSTASLRKLPIRDSIRVAKGRPRPGMPRGKRSFASQPDTSTTGGNSGSAPAMPANSVEMVNSMMMVEDAADPPNVPRFSSHSHSRKRSNTAPRMPTAIRSFSSNATMGASASASGSASAGIGNGMGTGMGSPSIDGYYPPMMMMMHHGGHGHGQTSGRSSFSRRTSEASGPSSTGTATGTAPGGNNFFDAIGTMRMEAFVDFGEQPMAMANRRRAPAGGGGGGGSGHPRPRQHHPHHPHQHHHQHQHQHARKPSGDFRHGHGHGRYDLESPTEDGSETSLSFRHEDPFRGF